METSTGGRSFAFVLGLGLGICVGGAVALVLAPQSGRRTRKQLRRWGLDAGDRVDDLKADARRAAERSSERVGDLLERSRRTLGS